MSEDSHDSKRYISSRSSVVVPISAIAGVVISVALLFFGQIQHLNGLIAGKADKTQAGDRYTRSEHDLYAEGERRWIESEIKRIESECR